jgi:hypothetical protein
VPEVCATTESPTSAAPLAEAAPPFPSFAPTATVAELNALQKQVEVLPAGKDGVDLLPDDWQTIGNWEGHYGSITAHLMGYNSFHDEAGYVIDQMTGPYRRAAMRYYWLQGDKDPARQRGLLDPIKNRRPFNENNDESYDLGQHPRVQEGPDIYISVTVPQGVHRVGLYFNNFSSQDGYFIQCQRDYPIFVKRVDAATPFVASTSSDGEDAYYAAPNRFGRTSPSATIEAELAPALVRTRVAEHYCGVWKSFLIRGAGTYWVKIGRNHGYCTKIQGVFIDRLDEPISTEPNYPKLPPATDYLNAGGLREAAARLQAALDAAVGHEGYAAIEQPARTAAYRAAVAAGIDADTLANWRWKMSAWEAPEKQQFNTFIKTLPPPNYSDNDQ